MTHFSIFDKMTPEEAGISAGSIVDFLNRLKEKGLCLHGFMLVRNKSILAEGYAPPYNEKSLHRMYSISKSFVSAAIGLLIGEGKIQLYDKVIKYFPDKLPEMIHPHISDMTIRDLLMMAVPFDSNTYTDKDTDWVETFFKARPTHAPGTVFSYNTAATVVLNALVEKLSGKLLLDYMRPLLLDKIGFSKEAYCIQRPEGGSWGGSGVLCTLRDLAAFAYVIMSNGRLDVEQLIPEDYVREAVKKQIDTQTAYHGSETRFGYGYQIWRTRNRGFAMIGMGGQYALCLPDKKTMLLTIADTQIVTNGASEILDSFFDKIYPHITDPRLPEDAYANNLLEHECSRIRLPLPEGEMFSKMAAKINKKKFFLEDNPMRIEHIRFDFVDNDIVIKYMNGTGEHELKASFGGYSEGVFPETHYYGITIGTPSNKGYRYMGSAAWTDENTLSVRIYITDDYLGTVKMLFSFRDNDVSILMTKVAEWFLNEYQGFAYGKESTSL